VWGAEDGDGHVDFFGSKDFKHIEDLKPLSKILCTEICPELIDVFDDGSGDERDVIKVKASSLLASDLLTNFYRKSE
jgi:hypothetical protein